ncbi:MFS transporter [Mesobacillus harenae]|uniref:MFS transporter n=1 Tax=Mesobacillus harenae TaxID=2213203 RepID=UPI0015803977|nr:MFS transporter [Mesobacillus harenae]
MNIYRDSRFYAVVGANIFSSVGTGITMIGIPWLLVSGENGGALYGYLTLVMTAINFVLTPAIGHLIDRVSRKKILLTGEVGGFILIALFSVAGFTGVDYHTWHYLVLYGTGSLYYNVFYPAFFAFNQEVFHPTQYKRLNGVMEIQGQLSSVLAGALAAVLITKVGLEWLLAFDAATYLTAALLIYLIPYVNVKSEPNGVQFGKELTEGFSYMKANPLLFWFLFASFMPFIGVMVTNYVFPVYLESVLKADASVYGMQSMVYGIGAAFAGLAIPWLTIKWGNEQVMVYTVFAYMAAISAVIFVKSIPVYFVLIILMAFGNAGTRVARNSYMMENVPNRIIGRVDSLFRGIGLGMRIILIAIFTQLAAGHTISKSFYILSAMMIFSFCMVILTFFLLQKQKSALLHPKVRG